MHRLPMRAWWMAGAAGLVLPMLLVLDACGKANGDNGFGPPGSSSGAQSSSGGSSGTGGSGGSSGGNCGQFGCGTSSGSSSSDPTAAETLQPPRQCQTQDAARNGTEPGCENEQRKGRQQQAPATEHVAQPAINRRGYRIRDQIGQHDNARRLYKVQTPAKIIRDRVTEIERPDWWTSEEEIRTSLRPEAAVSRG